MTFNADLNQARDLSGWTAMNLLPRLFAAGTLLAATQLFAADAFEGKVTYAMTTAGAQPQVMDYSIKGPRMRMDMTVAAADANAPKEKSNDAPPPKKRRSLIPGFLAGKNSKEAGDGSKSAAEDGPMHSTMIMDMEKMEMTTLMPDQKMYMVMSMKKAAEKAAAHAEKTLDATTDIERTGKTEKILGYTCDQILVKDTEKGTVTELWVASGLGTFMGLGGGNPMAGGGGGGLFGSHKSSSPAAAKWEEALRGKSVFPMRVITRDGSGVQTYRMEATKVEKGEQPDSLFVPPEDYKKFEMPSFGDLFKQG